MPHRTTTYILARRATAAALCALAALAGQAAQACDAVPKAVIDIDANRYYTDTKSSIIDPVLKARNVANTKPIEDFLDVVASTASSYQAKGQAEDAQCALTWLNGWAEQKALLGKLTTEQSYYVRKWTLGGLSLSYAKVQAAASPAQKQSVETWLKSLADTVVAHSDAHKGVRNNHYYWEGLAVTATGAVTHEQRFLDWGRRVFDTAMSQVAEDGSLPREMERASKALHYHVFAAQPLVLIASILDIHAAKLDQLMNFTLAAAKDPSGIAKATGEEQEPASAASLSWKIIYARHEGKPEWMPSKASFASRMGGDLNLANPLEHPAAAK